MQQTLLQIKTFLQSDPFKKYAKRFGFFILGLIAILLIACGALSVYFNQNKGVSTL